jgi:cell division control protein 6
MQTLFRPTASNGENSILLNEELLLPAYAPPEILHREAEIKAIAEAIKPLLEGHTGDNLFAYGNSGTGKTISAKHVLSELKEATSRVIPVYINCWETSTQMAIYTKILDCLGDSMPRRGLATDEVFERIKEVMEKGKIAVLVVLDEMDALVFRKEYEVLYSLSRAPVRFGIIGISSTQGLLAKLDTRVTSSLRFTHLEFKPYSTQQITDILAERAKLALAKGSWDYDILEGCAAIGKANGGNVRLALEMLWKAAHLAEKRDAKKIGIEDVREASKKTFYKKIESTSPVPYSFDIKDSSLSEEEKAIVEILGKGEITTTDLYTEFSKKFRKTKRQIRNYLDTLEAKGIIEMAEAKNAGMEHSPLKPRLVRLKMKA